MITSEVNTGHHILRKDSMRELGLQELRERMRMVSPRAHPNAEIDLLELEIAQLEDDHQYNLARHNPTRGNSAYSGLPAGDREL